MVSLKWKLAVLAVVLFFIKRSATFKQFLVRYRDSRLTIKKVVHRSDEFDRVLKAFKTNYLEGREKGSQLALAVNGSVVLEVHGGRDETSVFDDLGIVYSCSKVIESLCVAMLVDRGKLEYDAPIAKYWPEFGSHFSPTITVTQLMKHEAGLEQIHKPLTTKQATEIFNDIRKLEAYLYESMKVDDDVLRGERHTRYHAISRGFFVDVLIQKVDGRRARDFIQEEIVSKIPGVEYHLGCPPEAQSRVALFEATNPLVTAGQIIMHKLGIINAFFHPGRDATVEELEDHYREHLNDYEVDLSLDLVRRGLFFRAIWFITDQGLGAHLWANSQAFRALPLMSSTGVTNARSLALIGAELANDGGKLLSRAGLREAMESSGHQYDEILRVPVEFSKCGWSVDHLEVDWVGWPGTGGSMFAFSPKHRASFAYIPTLLDGRPLLVNGTRILKEFSRTLQESCKA